MNTDVATLPITVLKGVGPKLKEKLEQRLGWHSVQDVLFHLPFRYQDRTRLTPIGSLRPGQEALLAVDSSRFGVATPVPGGALAGGAALDGDLVPGDIVVRRPGFTFVFPLVTCLLLSLLVSLLFWIFRR